MIYPPVDAVTIPSAPARTTQHFPSRQDLNVSGVHVKRPDRPTLDPSDDHPIDEDDKPSLGVSVAGDSSARVVRVDGDLTAQGAELLSAITDHFLRDGSRTVRMDLADVTAADRDGLESVDRLRTTLGQQGVTLLVANRSIAVHKAARP